MPRQRCRRTNCRTAAVMVAAQAVGSAMPMMRRTERKAAKEGVPSSWEGRGRRLSAVGGFSPWLDELHNS
eukprot:189838-Prymnesium_polylepis.1